MAKNDPRIEAYGTVDELNSQLGLDEIAAELDDFEGALYFQQELGMSALLAGTALLAAMALGTPLFNFLFFCFESVCCKQTHLFFGHHGLFLDVQFPLHLVTINLFVTVPIGPMISREPWVLRLKKQKKPGFAPVNGPETRLFVTGHIIA